MVINLNIFCLIKINRKKTDDRQRVGKLGIDSIDSIDVKKPPSGGCMGVATCSLNVA